MMQASAGIALVPSASSIIHAQPGYVIAMSMMVVAAVEPAMYSIESSMRVLDVGRSSIYKLIGEGRLDARKVLGKTLITSQSLQALITAAPKADIIGNQTAQPAA
jgi:hypothetical protein